jgi:predicted DNA-binding protein with PD1-like motif
MRSIQQPGPPAAQRIVAVSAGSIPIAATLPAGIALLQGLHSLLSGGLESACLTLSGGALGPFAYVIPSAADAHHAAFYSAPRHPPGTTRLDAAAVTVGFRDGLPFFHCHGLWTEADGRAGCGHMLPDSTIIAAPIEVRGAGLIGARFEVQPDAETGFSLFSPVATGTSPPAQAAPAIALRLAPNQDLIGALEAAAQAAGFDRASLEGGVASINGARFQNAPPIQGYATELLVRRGIIRGTAGPPSELDIAIVDLHGAIGQGRLVQGDNPVLMTFEGALVADPDPPGKEVA